VVPRTSLDDMEKRKSLTLPGLELRPLGRPASSQSLYRLRYPGFLLTEVYQILIKHHDRFVAHRWKFIILGITFS
jgi:hypothetical protein